jgi:hypothetical protein
MLRLTDAGTVRHTAPGIHHAVQKPKRSEAEAAIAQLSEHLERTAKYDLNTARWLRQARDTLAVVVATAY